MLVTGGGGWCAASAWGGPAGGAGYRQRGWRGVAGL